MEAAVRRDEYDDQEGALNWCDKGLALFPQNLHLLNMSGLLCLDSKRYISAREIFLQLLTTERRQGMRCMFLNNIAYADALIDDPELLPEADAYSREALDIAPWESYVIGTRGTVLVAMGQFDEGIKLLKESLEKEWTPRNKAENACHLAIAYARMGDGDKANEYLKFARGLYPKGVLIARAEAELARMSVAE